MNGKAFKREGKKKKKKKRKFRFNNIAISSLPLTTEGKKRKSLNVSLTESIYKLMSLCFAFNQRLRLISRTTGAHADMVKKCK